MKLINLIPECNIDLNVNGLQNDSRKVQVGDIFLAYPGIVLDGRNYIQQAIDAGAVAVAYDPTGWSQESLFATKVAMIAIPNLANHLAKLASNFYGHPTRSLSVIGITGTNGKTTIAWQLAQAHELLGDSATYIGTLGQGRANNLTAGTHTTPQALYLQSLLYDYKCQGVRYVCMEVSSHALDQKRVDEINFSQAIYTNLSHDHLDYHNDMQTYAAAKANLFKVPSLEYAIINADDLYAQQMAACLPVNCKKLTYGLKSSCDVYGFDVKTSLLGTQLSVISPWGKHALSINMVGEFNSYNALAVYTSLLLSEYSLSDVIAVMARLKSAPGRMERVLDEPCVLVDYAHTPDALENVLKTLVKLKLAKIIVVFGCGGDRDKAKRPMMGRIASQNADYVILTSDNPRSEDPVEIIEDIAAGLVSGAHCLKIVDRQQAIQTAIDLASPNDIILIAGKGHENYQQIGQERLIFSDQAVVTSLTSE